MFELHLLSNMLTIMSARRKLEEWTKVGDPKELKLEVKQGEERYLEQIIHFCYSRQVTLTEGQPVHLQLAVWSLQTGAYRWPSCECP